MDQSPDLVMAGDRVRSCGNALVVPVSGMSGYRPDAEPVAGPIDPIVEIRKDRWVEPSFPGRGVVRAECSIGSNARDCGALIGAPITVQVLEPDQAIGLTHVDSRALDHN